VTCLVKTRLSGGHGLNTGQSAIEEEEEEEQEEEE